MMLDSAERATRLALAALPDGEAHAEGFLDDDGTGGPPTRIHATLRKRGDHLMVDLSEHRAAGARRHERAVGQHQGRRRVRGSGR
jgi:N-methylhydantoinase B